MIHRNRLKIGHGYFQESPYRIGDYVAWSNQRTVTLVIARLNTVSVVHCDGLKIGHGYFHESWAATLVQGGHGHVGTYPGMVYVQEGEAG